MSIFSHSKGEPNKSLNGSEGAAKPNTAPTSGKKSPDMVSTLGPAMQVTGNIVCEGSLQIFGRVIGDIHVSQLVICEGAQVEGNIVAHEASIHGVFKGNIHGNKVKLQGKAVVDSEIYNNSLTVEQDVQFNGVSRRLEKPIDSPSSTDAKTVSSSAMADKNPAASLAGLAAGVQ